MPEVRYFEVIQTRRVRVMANNATNAALIAEAAFAHGQNSDCGVALGKLPEGVWGNTRSRIREVELTVKEEGQ